MLEDPERLITAWNERQALLAPMIFSPTIGAAIKAGYWFLWVRCPACRTINAIDLRALDRHRDAAVSSLIPALSCRSCRPNAPFAELVRLSRTSIADGLPLIPGGDQTLGILKHLGVGCAPGRGFLLRGFAALILQFWRR